MYTYIYIYIYPIPFRVKEQTTALQLLTKPRLFKCCTPRPDDSATILGRCQKYRTISRTKKDKNHP